jgi:hypothetical protein
MSILRVKLEAKMRQITNQQEELETAFETERERLKQGKFHLNKNNIFLSRNGMNSI